MAGIDGRSGSGDSNRGSGASLRKPCIVCGAECDGRPRVKDPNGRYYCRSCYERTEKAMRKPAPPPPATDPIVDLIDFGNLAEAAAAAPAAATSALSCPACHAALDSGAVFCVHCGHDLRTGQRADVRVEKAPRLPRSSRGSKPPSAPGELGEHALDRWTVTWTLGLSGGLAFLIAYSISFAEAFVRNVERAEIMSVLGRTNVVSSATWSSIFLTSAIASLIGAGIWYLLGPWWFSLRVSFAGGEADTDAARSAYFVSSLPGGLLLGAAVAVALQGTPAAALDDASPTYTALVLAAFGVGFISCLWLFWIARRAFGVGIVRGLLLLVGLPWAYYVSLFIGIAVLLSAAEAAAERAKERRPTPARSTTAASVDHPITVTAPAGWTVTREPEEDGVWQLLVSDSEGTGAGVSVQLWKQDIDVAAWQEGVIESLQADGLTVRVRERITAIGRWRGEGAALDIETSGARGETRLLKSALPDQRWLLIEISGPADAGSPVSATLRQIVESIHVADATGSRSP